MVGVAMWYGVRVWCNGAVSVVSEVVVGVCRGVCVVHGAACGGSEHGCVLLVCVAITRTPYMLVLWVVVMMTLACIACGFMGMSSPCGLSWLLAWPLHSSSLSLLCLHLFLSLFLSRSALHVRCTVPPL